MDVIKKAFVMLSINVQCNRRFGEWRCKGALWVF